MNFDLKPPFCEYFKFVSTVQSWPYHDSSMKRSPDTPWVRLSREFASDDALFPQEFIRSMLFSFADLPAHRRSQLYVEAWAQGTTGDEWEISRFQFLDLAHNVIGAFMHFNETAELLEAFQPLFDETEELLAQVPQLTIEQFAIVENELRQRIYQRHTDVRRKHPGLIKWEPEGLS